MDETNPLPPFTPAFMAERSGVQTEFYQLVQAAVYHADGLWGEATFDLFAKELGPGSGYLVAAGIEPAIDAVLAMRFDEADVEWLRRHPVFDQVPDRFFESLRHFRFTGEIHAVPEGSVVFPGEPIVRVTAPLPQAGLLETRLIQTIGTASAVATRAARLVDAAGGRACIDFGARRCAGFEAAWHAARAAWIGGFKATTNTLAAATLGIPAWGVMSDSLLAAYEDPAYAYGALCQHFPGLCHVNLPDEDLQDGVRRLHAIRDQVPVVRLDHPDLIAASRALRRSLDRHEMRRTRILGSGRLDPDKVARIVAAGAPVELFGVGDWLIRGPNPAGLSYRIAHMYRGPDSVPVTSHFSAPFPGSKQVVRMADHDLLCLDVEAPTFVGQGGEALLRPVVENGERVRDPEPLRALRERRKAQVARLPAPVRSPRQPALWPVRPSDALVELTMRR